MNSSASEISRSVFRVIRASDHEWVGTGFVCFGQAAQTQRLYVTCAHVVASALGSDDLAYSEEAPLGEFFVDFPNSSIASKFQARVVPNDKRAWHRKERNANERKLRQDIALLSVDALVPDDVVPVEIKDLPPPRIEEGVFAFGGADPRTSYESNYGRLAEGIVQSELGSLLQFKAAVGSQNAFIEGGFSGGPLWSKTTGEVLGIVVIGDLGRNIAFAIPARALAGILKPGSVSHDSVETSNQNSEHVQIPFVYQRKTPELLLKRRKVEADVDEVIDTFFLTYLYGEKSAGKSSEVHRLHTVPDAAIQKDRTIWQPCITGTTFDEMADQLSEECLRAEGSRKLTPSGLISALHRQNLYLVLDGYSNAQHPTITPFLERAAPLNPPTRVVVVSSDEPTSESIHPCAVRIPRVVKEEVFESIEALGKELTSDLAQLVDDEDFDASAAYRIVREIRDGKADGVDTASSSGRTVELYEHHWTETERELMVCLALVESSVEEELFLELSRSLGIDNAPDFKNSLFADSLARDVSANAFSLRDFCKSEVLEKSDTRAVNDAHTKLGFVFREKALKKQYKGFGTPTSDLILAIRAIRHLQLSDTHVAERMALIDLVRTSAARKGMHRHLADVISFEVEVGSNLDQWNYIQLTQSELALGKVQRSFKAAKLAQRRIFSEKTPNIRLVVSLCNQFASVLAQANENALASHLLGVSKELFPVSSIDKSLASIRESLKAWCDGRLGKYDSAKTIGQRLLANAGRAQGQRRYIQVGVEATRLGILEGYAGKFSQADRLLLKGVENFSKCDRRGELWALSHLCFFRLKSFPLSLPRRELERLLDLQSTSKLVSEETYSHFRFFAQALQGDELRDRILSQSRAFEGLFEDKILGPYDIEYIEAFIEFLLLEFKVSRRKPKSTSSVVIGYLNRERIDEASEEAISYMGPLVDEDPSDTLSTLYKEIPHDKLIKSPFYSRMVTQLLLRIGDEKLIDTFYETHFDKIKTAPRFVRLNYVGFFERCNRADLGISLLKSLKGMEGFRFHNIAANCYKRSSFDTSKYHNEQALLKASSPEAQARIHNNIAALFLLHGKLDQAEYIRGQVEAAIELRASHFWWPYRTKLALDLNQNDVVNFNSVLSEYSRTQRLSERAIKYISELIPDPLKRMDFLGTAPQYLTN